MAIRKNAANLTPQEINTFVSAVKELKRRGRYDRYVMQHASAVMGNIHRCSAFLPWHRQLLWELEKELQDISGDPNLGLPYWHWGENAELPNPEDYRIWSNDFLGPGGRAADGWVVKSGPFRDSEWIGVGHAMMGIPAAPLTRLLGQDPSASLPTKDQIEAMLRVAPFDITPYGQSVRGGFRNLLEGWYGGNGPMFHNAGHVWVGGSMGPMTSPNDPIFFLHHCFVDKLWWDWQQRHTIRSAYLPISDGRPTQNMNDLMEAGMTGRMTPNQVLFIDNLGYSYDVREPQRDTSIVFNQAPPGFIVDVETPPVVDPPVVDPPVVDPPVVDPPVVDPPVVDPPVVDPPVVDPPVVDPPVVDPPGENPSPPVTPPSPPSDPDPTPVDPTPSPGASGKGCMLTLTALLMIFLFFACNANKGMGKIIGFEMYPQKSIGTSAYWYFDITPGTNDVYKVLTSKEAIYFEVPGGQTSFTIENNQLASSNVKVISKNNDCFLGEKGMIKGQLSGDQLDIEIDLESVTAKSNAKGEFIIKDKYEKERHTVKTKGNVSRVKK